MPWITVTDYRGTGGEVRIPEEIEGLAVRAVDRKAFFSRKNLRKAVLPETLEEIGDWAFACCTGLESVWLPKRRIKLGNRVFMRCPGIREIYAYDRGTGRAADAGAEKNGDPGQGHTAALLAAAAVMLDAEYLLDIEDAGSEQWLRKWDARMKAVMETEDDDGYTKMILGGEEDCGYSLEEFVRNRRINKARLAMLRLLHPAGLGEENAASWKQYLLNHAKGGESEEAWEVLLEEHGHEEEYFRLFVDTGAVNGENLDAVLKDMAGDYTEMKAFFIGHMEKYRNGGDFFGALSLDD